MARKHTVGEGECLSSIASENGYFWPTLWDDPANADLRARRTNPHVLRKGDEVTIPDLRPKEVEAETGRRHTFRRKGVPEKLRVRFGSDEFPRAGVPYVLVVDGDPITGKTDAKGELAHYLAPSAREAEILLRPEGGPEERYPIALRDLDPIDTVRGVKLRLRNLGYYGGRIDDVLGPEVVEAMRGFQARSGLPATDAPDAATRDALLEAHGC
jgi:N-acetylmuramoyl-L-alanine amidase